MTPLLPEFGSDRFSRQSKEFRPIIEAMLAADCGFIERDIWRVHRVKHREKRPFWQSKIYVCVRARDYWPAVSALMVAFHGEPIRWKFFFGKRGYERPDKIVFYPLDRDRVRLVRRLRALLDGTSFHTLGHAASTVETGLEPKGAEGLFVGVDPVFLKISWRAYRAACFAWLGVNRAYVESLRGGLEAWLRVMNLSLGHEGPLSFQPKTDPKLIRRYWRQIL